MTVAVVVGIVGMVAVAVAAVPSRRALTAGLALAIRGPAAAPAVPVGGGEGGGAMRRRDAETRVLGSCNECIGENIKITFYGE